MRNRSLLPLMEQMVMLAVFALAAVLCVQAFVLADRTSHQCAEQDRGIIAAQNAAEQIKCVHGDLALAAERYGGTEDGLTWDQYLDENWNPVQKESAYHVKVSSAETGIPFLGRAQITVQNTDGEILASLPAAWQEVEPHA